MLFRSFVGEPPSPETLPGEGDTIGVLPDDAVVETKDISPTEDASTRPALDVLTNSPEEAPAATASLTEAQPSPEAPPADHSFAPPAIALPEARWPFRTAILLLSLTLVGQLVFFFRGEIAAAAPSLRPLMGGISQVAGTTLPLPANIEKVSIEAADLQADPKRADALLLQATLRNRAGYAQRYPLLELTLTDADDQAIARRVFPPDEYLPPDIPTSQAFGEGSERPIRLWLSTGRISAAGYRLYVFYP